VIDLDQVRTFVAIVEIGSFRDAATRLGIAQPTASQHVRKLEAELGHPLIERTRVRAEPTAYGARFLPFARTLLRVAGRAQAALGHGTLAVGASSNIGIYLLQPILKAFHATQPSIRRVDVRIGTNLDTVKRLEDGEIDICLTEWWDDRRGFEAGIWRRENLVVIVSPEHPWARRKSIDKAALLVEPMIGGEPGTGTARLLRQAFGVDTAMLKMGLQLGSTEAVKQAVRAGLGISITLESAVRDEVGSGVLHALRVRDTRLSKPLFSSFPDSLPPGNLARRFDAFLRQQPAHS
jgi:DNA-binding transcriptional LysR family regulator